MALFCYSNDVTFSQEKIDSNETKNKNTLNAIINANTTSTQHAIPVPYADVIIELPSGEKGTIRTNERGEFAISFSNIENMQGKNSKVINLTFTIIPDRNFLYNTTTNVVNSTLNKSDGPFFVFILKYAVNNFSVVHKPLVRAPGQGGKQGKGSAVKTGDKYQGEVRHF